MQKSQLKKYLFRLNSVSIRNHPDLIHRRRENQSSGFIFSNDILNLIRDYTILLF